MSCISTRPRPLYKFRYPPQVKVVRAFFSFPPSRGFQDFAVGGRAQNCHIGGQRLEVDREQHARAAQPGGPARGLADLPGVLLLGRRESVLP
eukprot:4774699-Pyramimonas_sp.AAC.1